MSATTLLVGPGWLGAPTAAHLASSGMTVWTLRRGADAPPAGCIGLVGTPDAIATDASLRAQLPARVDHVVATVAPSRGRGDDHGIYPQVAEGIRRMAEALSVRSVLWVSSTGVYDRQDGSEVDETTPLTPHDGRVAALVEAEQIIASIGEHGRTAARIVRPAGLYGPGRDPGPRFAQGDPLDSRWCNFSWRDDVRDAIAHLIGQPTHDAVSIFNCTDGHPVQAGAITRALQAASAAVTPPATSGGARREARSNQRIRTEALRATGWRPQVATVFDGLQRLGHAVQVPSA